MTIPEMIGGAVAALTAAVGAYGAVSSKIDGALGRKPKGDDALRDVVLRIEGKLAEHSEDTSRRLESLTGRIANIEHRVFTPPARMFPAASARKPR